MFNISKQGSSLLITSNDNSQFPWKDGQMSLPMNSVVYVIDESDYIAFRSASNNDILFTALIDEIQINGTNVTKDDFILQFDNVANSAGGGGGSASAGVNSINGFQGDLTLKSINGQSLIGSGNIEIEGGSDLISINANNSSNSLNVGSGNTGDLYGTILVGRDIVNKYNAAVLIGNNVTNTVGDRNNITVNICNSLMADSSGNMYFWKNGKVEKLQDYAVYKEWSGTQAEYDALGTYDDNTIYNIIEG